jgi:hypothetical protein
MRRKTYQKPEDGGEAGPGYQKIASTVRLFGVTSTSIRLAEIIVAAYKNVKKIH